VRLELLQDAAEFWPRARADILAAHERVYLQALSFEGDAAGREVAATLAASHAPDRRVLVDCFTKHVVSDRLVWLPKNLLDPALREEVRATEGMQRDLERAGVSWRFVSPLGPFLLRAPALQLEARPRRRSRRLRGRINFSDTTSPGATSCCGSRDARPCAFSARTS
jgi:hypothetical protein